MSRLRRLWVIEKWTADVDEYLPHYSRRTRTLAMAELPHLRQNWPGEFFRVRCYVPREAAK